MKKILVLITVFMFTLSSLSSIGYAGGDKNCGTKGKGSTGTVGNSGIDKGAKTQKRLPIN
jgi:hypothetical protein